MKKIATKNRAFYGLIALVLAIIMIVPAALSATSNAASKPKVKITTNMDTHDKVYVGTKTTLKIKTSTSSTLTFKTSDSKIATVKNGRLYAYRPGTAKIKIYAKPKSSRYTTGYKYFYVDVLPGKPGTPSAIRSGSKINVSVNKTSGAYGYQYVYATNSKFSGYKRITTRNTSCSFTASSSKNYYVKARAYAKVNGKTYYSGYSGVRKVSTAPSGPKITELSILGVTDSGLHYNSITDRPSRLECKVRPFGAEEFIVWKSSNKNVATVNSSGDLKLIGPGTCTITVSSPDGKISDSCKVTVSELITKITLDKTNLLLANKGRKFDLNATVSPGHGNNDNSLVKWKSSNTSIASIDEYGVINVKMNGTCTITAYAKNNPSVKATCKVTVHIPNGLEPDHPYIKQVVELTNRERVKAGLPAVVYDRKVTEAALIRARELEQLFSHTRPDGRNCFTVLDDVGVSYRPTGENAAGALFTPEDVVRGWMNSTGHRNNILNSNCSRIGVGFYQDASGENQWIQIFTE